MLVPSSDVKNNISTLRKGNDLQNSGIQIWYCPVVVRVPSQSEAA